MRFVPTGIDGVVKIDFDVHRDERGSFMRSFSVDEFTAGGIDFQVVQANVSTNAALHTLRGMHFQRDPHGEAKVVTCLQGRIYDVAVDVRPGSPTYLQWEGCELGEGAGDALYMAAGIAHGFLTLERDTLIHYLMGAPYVADAATGIRWDDPAVAIRWPATPAVISQRDRDYPLIETQRN